LGWEIMGSSMWVSGERNRWVRVLSYVCRVHAYMHGCEMRIRMSVGTWLVRYRDTSS
jgi:hypothetical protein